MEDQILTPRQQTLLSNEYPLFGMCNSTFALLQVEKTFLAPFLPAELELANQTYTDAQHHPLLLMFNYTHLQSNPLLVAEADESDLALDLNYNEFIVMLPYVQFKVPPPDAEPVYCFLPILYLDSLLAVLGGRIFWEFNKKMAYFETPDSTYNVYSEIGGTAYFSTELKGLKTSFPAKSVPNFVDIEPILNLPVIEFGHYGYVSSIYVVEYENAIISPCTVTLTEQACRYLPPGVSTIGPITGNALGAFHIDYDWKLSYTKYIKP